MQMQKNFHGKISSEEDKSAKAFGPSRYRGSYRFHEDDFGYKIGMWKYAIIYVRNAVGAEFFYNPKGNQETDYLWDFIHVGFCMFPNYESIPADIRNNAVELSFIAEDLRVNGLAENRSNRSRIRANKELCRRFYCEWSEEPGVRMKKHITDRGDLPNKMTCDFILVKEIYYDASRDLCNDGEYDADECDSDGYFITDVAVRIDVEIVRDICYDAIWAGGRYFMRIYCLSADLSEEEEMSLDYSISNALYAGGFTGGRYWRNPQPLDWR